MNSKFIGIIFLIIISSVSFNVWAKNVDTAFIDRQVSQLIELLKDQHAEEYTKARKIEIQTLDEKLNVKVAVAIFAIEEMMSSNAGSQYIVCFTSLERNTAKMSQGNEPRFRLLDVMKVVGCRVKRLESISEKKGALSLKIDILEYGEADTMCCPSKTAQALFTIDPSGNSRLQRINKSN